MRFTPPTWIRYVTPTLTFDGSSYDCAACGNRQVVLCEHWQALFERSHTAMEFGKSPAPVSEDVRKLAREAVTKLEDDGWVRPGSAGINVCWAIEALLADMLHEERRKALEEAAQIVLMDACDKLTCDIPAHENAQIRATQIRALAAREGAGK